MEEKLKDRLIEAAVLAQSSPGFRMMVTTLGIFVQYAWEKKTGLFGTVERIVTWEEIEGANVNPISLAMTSLSKEAAAKQ